MLHSLWVIVHLSTIKRAVSVKQKFNRISKEAFTNWAVFLSSLLSRIPGWLLRSGCQLWFLPTWTPVLTSTVSSRVPLPLKHRCWSPGGRPALCSSPLRRPKVHGHDLPRRHPQPRARHDWPSPSQSTGWRRFRRRSKSTLHPHQQHELQWPHVSSWSRDGGEYSLVGLGIMDREEVRDKALNYGHPSSLSKPLFPSP